MVCGHTEDALQASVPTGTIIEMLLHSNVIVNSVHFSNKFLWRWWKGYSLLNLHTGKCLTANDPRRSTAALV